MTSVNFDAAMLSRYDRPGPRYTSYPTAVQLHDGFSEYEYHDAARGAAPGPLSVYVHIPFCASPCFYCGCNRVITRSRAQAEDYLVRLRREIGLQSALYAGRPPVGQLHFGGGTPTFLDAGQLSALLDTLDSHLGLRRDGSHEYSIEVDPRTAGAQMIGALAQMGFNRLSLGVQDFDPAVQRAVNRIQPREQTLALIEAARASGFGSVSVDLIYGLPRQDLASFDRTLSQVIDCRPDRVAAYSYAHMPQLFKAQRQIDAAELPGAAAKLALLGLTIRRLTGAGYVYIGMDHFALPTDPLAIALRDGSLHRNFQGYSTRAGCELLGLGMSAIGQVGEVIVQNQKRLPEYYAALDAGRLPVWRGLRLSQEDRLRGAVIQSIMCRGQVDYAAHEREAGICFETHFATELAALAPLAADGLLEIHGRGFRLSPAGRLLMRVVAMCFDAWLPGHRAGPVPRFSQAI